MGHIININYGGTTAVTRSEVYNLYVADTRSYKLLSQEEEKKLLKEYTTITDNERKIEIRNTLLNANQRFVIAAAKQYANGDTNVFLDMISEATLGFIEAIERYDFNKVKGDKKLISWAAFYIRRQCNSYLINYRSMIYQSNSHATYHKLAKARSVLSQKLGREATDEEVAEYLVASGLPIKDIRDVRKMTVSSIDISTSDEDEFNPSLADFNSSTANNNSYERTVDKSYASEIVYAVLKTLSERDREIIKMLYGLNDENIEYPYEAIAEKMGFSKERIRQIHMDALKKMAVKIKAKKIKV